MSWQPRANPGPLGQGSTKHPQQLPPQPSQQLYQPQQQQQQAAQNANPNPNHPLSVHQQPQWGHYPSQTPNNQSGPIPNNQPIIWLGPAHRVAPAHQTYNNNWQQPNAQPLNQQHSQDKQPPQNHQQPPTHQPPQNHQPDPQHIQLPPAQQPQLYKPAPTLSTTYHQTQPSNAFQHPAAQSATFANDAMSGEPDQFKATALFDKNATTGSDGWGEDWGWNDTSNNNTSQAENIPQPLTNLTEPTNTFVQHSFQTPAAQTMFHPTNQPVEQSQFNQSNQHQFTSNANHYQSPPPPIQQHQELAPQQQPTLHPQFSPMQGAPSQPQQSHPPPPMAQQPQQIYQPNQQSPPAPFAVQNAQTLNQSPFVGHPQPVANIADSFNSNVNNNWNWNPTASSATILDPLADTPSTLLETAPGQFATVGKSASDKHHSRNVSNGSNAGFDQNYQHSQPDEPTNTHLLADGGRSGTNQLTPQWSIESQVSQTSSDRSVDTRSSLTNTSEEHPYQQKFPPKPFQPNVHEDADQRTNQELDFLTETLHSLNVEPTQINAETIDQRYWQQSHQFNQTPSGSISLPNSNPSASEDNREDSPDNHAFGQPQSLQHINNPHPKHAHENASSENSLERTPPLQTPLSAPSPPQPNASFFQPQATASPFPPPSNSPFMPPPSNSPFMPPPSQSPAAQLSQSPFQPPNLSTAPPINTANIPPPTQFTTPPLQSSQANNPFKRAGALNHKTLHFQPTNAPNQPHPQEQSTTYFQTPPMTVVENEPLQPENSEVIPETPHNDRNQYLQTGHLSEENVFSPAVPILNQNAPVDPIDYLPPPGLSRLVLGQPETNSTNNQTEPPPGLDRMVPGTELVSSLNMERHADGQDTNTPSIPTRSATTSTFIGAATPATSAIPVAQPAARLQNTDRNLYLVPGDESYSGQAQGQRVVTGHNNSDEQITPPAAIATPNAPTTIASSSEQRELIMDGENLEDEPQIRSRDEPLEGANHLDDSPQTNDIVSSAVHDVPSAAMVNNKKYPDGSLAGSTGNDDSDRERSYYKRGSSQRRTGDDSQRRREKNIADKRYETEDTDFSDREKETKRYGREGSIRRTGDKDRASGRYPESGRGGERNREERLDRGGGSRREGDRYAKEKYRYETDGSRYATEDSRYDRQPRRRGEEPRKEEGERKYRRGGEPRSDGRRRDDRYREERDRDHRRANNSSRGADSYDRHGGNEFDVHRSNTRNATERSAEWYYSQPQQQQPPVAPQYGMDQYQQYYQQMQYYENLRRTNPQAYAEIYHRMYSQQQQQGQQEASGQTIGGGILDAGVSGPTDGRESVHSGRSSTNERYTRPPSTNQQHNMYFDPMIAYRQPQTFSQQHNSTMLESSIGYAPKHNGQSSRSMKNGSSRSQYASHNEYSALRSGRLDSGTAADSMTVDEEPARMTPCKFTRDHCTASLANGLMVCVKPQFSAHSDFTSVVRIMQIGANDAKRKLFQLYPGPLARGVTHKKTVIEFCEEQIRLGPQGASPANSALKSRGNSMSSLYSQQSQLPTRSSYTLMWNLLILLLRQNGVVVGTDISELLLSNRKEFPYDVLSSDSKDSSVGQQETVAEDENESGEGSAGVSSSEGQVSMDPPVSLANSSAGTISEEEITERFRSYLLYGSINEALDWAADNNLWGHALFLASKVDRRSHANVLMKFANKLSLNDPLQTLYQLMSGRTPNSVTSIADEKWGDWRPHLAMILANTSPKPELDRKSITTLGDSLYNRGDLFAAQFCYLMAQVGFGRYCNVNQDSVLMSSSSSAIRLILLGSSHHRLFREFATNEAIMMTEIYEYACTLNDDHFSIVDFQAYKYLLATRMLDAGLNLKSLMYLEQITQHIQKNPSKFDGGFIQKVYTLADQLKYFDPVYERMMYEPNSSNEEGPISAQSPQMMEDQPWLQGLLGTLKQYNSADNAIYSNEPISYPEQSTVDSLSTINREFVEISQQFSNLSTQYTGQTEQPNDPIAQAVYQPYQSLPPQPETNIYDPYANQPYEQAAPTSLPTNFDNYGYDPNQSYQPQQPEQPDQQSYEYWNQQQQFQPENSELEMSKPSISMPNSMSNKPNFYDDDEPTGGSRKSAGPASSSVDPSSTNASKAGPVIGGKPSGQSSTSNSGWFGGLWNKLSLKPKNQMILPDDKNPSIVWDSDKKKWVNTDGEVEASEQFRPPPKMADLAPKLGAPALAPPTFDSTPVGPPQFGGGVGIPSYEPHPITFAATPVSAMPPSVPSPGPPNMVAPSIPVGGFEPHNNQAAAVPAVDPNNVAKTPNLQSNMFKMQRNRTLKKSYVDVFNPSGAPSKPLETAMMAPLLPSGPPSGFFIPGGAAPSGQQEDGNHFYNPNQFAGANGPSPYQ